jgi:hypothetical protein
MAKDLFGTSLPPGKFCIVVGKGTDGIGEYAPISILAGPKKVLISVKPPNGSFSVSSAIVKNINN